MLIDTAHPAFEDRKVTFNGVGVDLATAILASFMVDVLVFGIGATQATVLPRFVGKNAGFTFDILFDDRHQFRRGDAIDNIAGCTSGAALNKAQNLHFMLEPASAFLLGVIRVLADESFVDLDNATVTAHRGQIASAHGFTNAVRHEPSGFKSNTQSEVKLVAGNALLAGTHEIDRLQPNVHCNVAGFKNGADFDSEGLPAFIALVNADPG